MKVAQVRSFVAGTLVLASTVIYLRRTVPSDVYDDVPITQNANRILRHRRRSMTEPCLALSANKRFEDGLEEEDLCYCELRGNDLDGEGYKMVQITGLPDGWCKDNIDSAETQFFAWSTDINYNTNELLIQSSGNDVVYSNVAPAKEIRLTDNNVFSVLVLRGNGLDKNVTASSAELSDSIFGTNGDSFNLRSQYRACSYDQMIFNAVLQEGTTGGVYDVSVDKNIIGTPDHEIRNEMVSKAKENFGTDLGNIADFVMACIPPGTPGQWIAYAYGGYYLSVYNDRWCTFPSAQMHELGHNMALSHSGEHNNKYGDQSGMMGYSYFSKNGPRMCFNGAKTFQLGWFKEYHQEFSSNAGFFSWADYMVGFVHRELATDGEKMIVRISDQDSNIDYFVHFNRRSGFNGNTREGGNKVLVASASWDHNKNIYLISDLLAKLDAGASFTIPDFGGISGASLTIFVPWILLEPRNKARVEISFSSPLTAEPSPSPISPTQSSFPSALPTVPYPSALPTLPYPSTVPTIVYPSTVPTVVYPSALPTIPYPSARPSALPTVPFPSALPTMIPTASFQPSESCKDDELFEFIVRFERSRRLRNCSWVASDSRFIDVFCALTNVKDNCILTCDNC
mmetsp:Transcript_19939/g.29570  ORF Transcript_19939/g.29570 Transcript_19939/m.29570 type:complete len:625 (-) Transcript_19939:1231-3105(-)|eukprot:CAMPEP_0194223480 /NCGR_PEP_ID=MMETSP0156-20130528/35247_1 /TAXON_ID=33649 /ORGANISM="Thalassionema nitzschioides, Strain L26-B" /LENGTH=624 /DNA_ID=CAMNT_0038954653 /DNA_START=95 /DNA_END=1969 /DNA_ORIENTATION=-